MDYQKIYDTLMKTAILRNLPPKGMHRHHIVPVSFGGNNRRENFAVLTYREHFLAHALLVKMHPVGSTERFKMLCAMRRLDYDGRFTSKTFSAFQLELNSVLSERFSGAGNPNFGGVCQTEDAKLKMRGARVDSSRMGRWTRSAEHNAVLSVRQSNHSSFVANNPMKDPALREKVAASKIGKRAHFHTDMPGIRKMFSPASAPSGWAMKEST